MKRKTVSFSVMAPALPLGGLVTVREVSCGPSPGFQLPAHFKVLILPLLVLALTLYEI